MRVELEMGVCYFPHKTYKNPVYITHNSGLHIFHLMFPH